MCKDDGREEHGSFDVLDTDTSPASAKGTGIALAKR